MTTAGDERPHDVLFCSHASQQARENVSVHRKLDSITRRAPESIHTEGVAGDRLQALTHKFDRKYFRRNHVGKHGTKAESLEMADV